MAEMVKCPACGEMTAKEFEFCQYCQARLQPLTGNLRGENAPIKPGESPTKKSTAELERTLPKWLRDARETARESDSPAPSAQSAPPAPKKTPSPNDFLSGLRSQAADDEEEEIPDWLANITGTPASPKKKQDDDGMRWMNLGASQPAAPAPEPEAELPPWMKDGTSEQGDSQDWLRQISGNAIFDDSAETGETDSFASADTTFDKASAGDEPDWLRSLGAESAPATPAAAETPDWLSSLGAESAPAAPAAAETPDWLSSLGAESAPATPAAAETPDWLAGMSAAAPVQEEIPSWLQSAGAQTEPAPAQPAPSSDFSSASVSSSLGEADALFAQTPDWLSSAEIEPSLAAAAETPVEETIEASQLPSWVQALRPVESVIGESSATPAAETVVETQGALAGLQGVLPAADFKPTSKPKPILIKLQASEDQLAQAALLEQIIAAETSPVPIASYAPLRSSPILRWALALLFAGTVFGLLLAGMNLFSLPTAIPAEAEGVLKVVEGLPAGAPVLAAFDYEPARAGELESAAAPLFDQLAMKGARFAVLSTNETGAALAEHFINYGALAEHRRNGTLYVNLGYLPGGQMGIRAFAQKPQQIARYDIHLKDPWASPALQGVSSLADFGAFIIVTDNADAARAWIEQLSAANFAVPAAVVSSAQSSPMILPYYASGQIRGLISGLYGGAIYEQINAGRPGAARRYWDAYSVGLLLAAALIFLGSAWNLIASRRERAAREAD